MYGFWIRSWNSHLSSGIWTNEIHDVPIIIIKFWPDQDLAQFYLVYYCECFGFELNFQAVLQLDLDNTVNHDHYSYRSTCNDRPTYKFYCYSFVCGDHSTAFCIMVSRELGSKVILRFCNKIFWIQGCRRVFFFFKSLISK